MRAEQTGRCGVTIEARSPGEDVADAPVHLHPAGLHRAALGRQVHGGLTRLSLRAAAHGASEALPSAPALPGQGAAGGKGRCVGWHEGGRAPKRGSPGFQPLLCHLLVV